MNIVHISPKRFKSDGKIIVNKTHLHSRKSFIVYAEGCYLFSGFWPGGGGAT